MVCMSMYDQIRAVPVYYFGQARTAQIGIDFRRFSCHRTGNGRIVQNHHPLGGAELGHSSLQLHGLVNRSLHKRLNLGLPKGSQDTTPEAANKALGPGEADSVCRIRNRGSRAPQWSES